MYEERLSKQKSMTKIRLMTLVIMLIFIGASFIPFASPQQTTVSIQMNQDSVVASMPLEGQILYSPMYSTMTYLRESSGTVNHSWSSSYLPGCMVRWVGDGSIIRTIRVGVGPGAGGAGGGVQKVEWDGSIVWDYRYNTNGDLSHHDVCILPNGNVLLIAWETKTRTESIAAGRNPSYVGSSGLQPDHIIEVQPTGPTSGDIVWEWHVWDHLIQNYDPSKANYGVVADHPELVDINFVTSSFSDLMHTNSIDYNEKLDQIVVSVRYYSEIWVIDHSTTTSQAAGHTGGNSGKGGDLLYRWGNPQVYDRGSSSDRKLWEQHDTTWIDEGCPGEGNILIFNNGWGRSYSTVDEIVPPVDVSGIYYIAQGAAYGPSAPTWMYNPTPHFYASHLSGATRLASGNTLICNGENPGKLFEVTPTGSTVWQYSGTGEVLKVEYIPPVEQQPPNENKTPNLECSGILSWDKIQPGATVSGSFQVENIGDEGSLLNWTVNTSSITWGNWTFSPESGMNLTRADGQKTVQVTVITPNEPNTEFEGYLRIENINNQSDYDTIPVTLKTPVAYIPQWWILLQQVLFHFLQNHILLEKLWNFIS